MGAAKVWDANASVWRYIAQGYPGPQGIQGEQGEAGRVILPPFSVGGILAATTYTMRLYLDAAGTIQYVRASVGSAPAGSSIVIDVLKNGTTLFTGGSDRPTIAAGNFTDTGIPAVTSLADGDYLTVSIISVGSTTPGSDLTVQVVTI